MKNNLIAKAQTTIDASPEQVWEGLTNPKIVKQYMYGTDLQSDWKKGSKIKWKGEFEGKPYEDKGEILDVIPNKKLSYTHFSAMGNQEDKPENYHQIDIQLKNENGKTRVELTQDKNQNEQQKTASEKNWNEMLGKMKDVLEV